MLVKFKNIKKVEEVQEMIVYTNNLEETGDKLFENAIRNLYKFEKNPIEISKWYKIYECLEKCSDSCESVANCVEEIIMKNA